MTLYAPHQHMILIGRAGGRGGDKHDYRDKHRGPQPLQQDVGQRLEYRVRYEEDGERRVVFPRAHVMQTLLQTVDFRVADVGAVEEGEEVEDTELLY